MAHMLAAAVDGRTWLNFSASASESMDVNGKMDDLDDDGDPEMVQADPRTLTFHVDFAEGEQAYQDFVNAGCPESHPYSHCCTTHDLDTDFERAKRFMTPKVGWQWRIYYDLFDAAGGEPAGAFFPVDGGAEFEAIGFDDVDGDGDADDPADHPLMDVLLHYLGSGPYTNPGYVDRGMNEPDLVDVLDGMICRGHMTQQDAQVLLQSVMGYDYDFNGPGTCP